MKLFQKKIPRGVIYHSVLDSIRYLIGSFVSPLNEYAPIQRFETAFAKYNNREHCISFPFARTGIYYILKHLDLPRGSEVLLPPITIKGIVDVVLDLGLTPLYVDVELNTVNFDINDLSKKINPKVRAAIVTPLFGLVPDMTAITSLLRLHNIYIIEDFSQCLNGKHCGKGIGTFGNAAVYSASSIKTLDTLGGGLVITDDATLAAKLRNYQAQMDHPSRSLIIKKAWTNLVRNVATTNPVFSLLTFPALQLLRRIDPSSALKQTGNRDKSRLSKLPKVWFTRYSSLQACIGLEHLDQVRSRDKARITNVELIKSGVPHACFPNTTPLSSNVYWQLIVHTKDASSYQKLFSKQGIDIATSSLELVCELQDFPGSSPMPRAKQVYENGIFVPCYPTLTAVDVRRTIAALQKLSDQ